MKFRAAIPTHSRTLSTATAETLLRLQRALIARGDGLETEFFSGAIISDVRNAMVADFLHSDADVLIMLDADMGAPTAAVLRMIDFGQPVVGCIYPRRSLDWSRLQGAPEDADPARLLRRALDFVGVVEKSPEASEIELRQGFARAIQVGAGLLVLRREVFEVLTARHPELAGTGFPPRAFPGPRFAANWGVFNPVAVPGAPNVSEDFSFCHRWRAAGGEIWADVSARIAHVGPYDFGGSFL